IGVFDSGLGGLTVVRALIDLLPDEHLVYFGDTGRFPYGPKPREEVLKYAFEITELLMGHDVKLVVVGCNSAAAAALADLRARYEVPLTGVIEPGLRAAAKATRSGRIGVIGTVGTIASGAYQRAAEALFPHVELTCAACPGFVEFVEAGDVGSGVLLRSAGAVWWLACGNGTLAALQRHVPVEDVTALVIAHWHPDHCADVYGLHVVLKYGLGRTGFPVFAPEGTETRLAA